MTKAIKHDIFSIEWNDIINEIKFKEGASITPSFDKWNLDNSEYIKIYNMWKEANFNISSIKWINYYPEEHFPQTVIDCLSLHLNVSVLRAWISRIDPGFFAPWHWDVDDKEHEYLEKGYPKRFSCFIEEPDNGHLFVIGDECFYNQPQGTIVEWGDYKDWHCGSNAGITPKFMLHLLGISKS
jgi:hypothetical protein